MGALGFVHYISKFTISRFVISRFECTFIFLDRLICASCLPLPPNKKNLSFDVENNVRKTINFHLDVDEKYWILLFFKIVFFRKITS